MIHVIKEIMFDCAYENVVQTEVMFEEKEYNLNNRHRKYTVRHIEKLKVRYLLCYKF